MVKKIEGFVDGTGEGPDFKPYKEGNRYIPFWEGQGISQGLGLWRPATIILHKGKVAERVFTESEVRAMFISLSQRPGVSWQSLLKVAKEHDVVLDPA